MVEREIISYLSEAVSREAYLSKKKIALRAD
jgi:hypothetical protein